MTFETDEIVWPGKMAKPPRGKPEKRYFKVVTKQEEPYMIYLPPDPETGKCGHHQVQCFVQGENLSGWVCRFSFLFISSWLCLFFFLFFFL